MRRCLEVGFLVLALIVVLDIETRLLPQCVLGQQNAANPAEQYSDAQNCSSLSSFIWGALHPIFSFLGVHINDTVAVLTALATAFIAGFTYTLKQATDNLWLAHGDALAETKRIAGEEFVATYAPRIRVKHVWLASEIWHQEEIKIRIVMTNVGKTIARVTGGQIVMLIREKERDLPIWPEMPPPLKFIINAPGYVDMHSGVTFDLAPQLTGKILTEEENAALRDGTKLLYCIGDVEYRDRDSRVRKTAFCRVLKMPTASKSYRDSGRFVIHRDPEYEY